MSILPEFSVQYCSSQLTQSHHQKGVSKTRLHNKMVARLVAHVAVLAAWLALLNETAWSSDVVRETSGLYILLRNETTRVVSARQVTVTPAASLSQWSAELGQCSLNVEIVGYATMDSARHTFIGRDKREQFLHT